MAVDIAAIREKLKAITEGRGRGGSGGMNTWRPEIGEHKIRCLPWPDAEPGMPFHELAFYYFGDNRVLAPFQFGQRDPFKEVRDRLFSTKKEEDKTLAKRLLPKTRAYVPIVVRGQEADGVKIWSVGKEIHARLLGFFVDADIGDFLDVGEGFDLKVTVSKQPGKKFNDTAVDVARKQSPAMQTREEISALLKQIPNLKEVYKPKTYDECKRQLDEWISAGAPAEAGFGTERGDKPEADDASASSDKKQAKADDGASADKQKKTKKTLDDLESMFKSAEK